MPSMATATSPVNATASSSSQQQRPDLWAEILRGADRRAGQKQAAGGRKNVILLSEPHHGRRHLLSQLLQSSEPSSRSRRHHAHTRTKQAGAGAGGSLAMGYEVLEVRDDGDEDTVPPVSIFYPPSSHPAFIKLVPTALPPDFLADTAVLIVLDWSKPSNMVDELLTWLSWVEEWAKGSAGRGEAEELRERLQSHLQHYSEPSSSSSPAGPSSGLPSLSSTIAGGGPLLPLGPGTLTLNSCGIPIIVVCTRADLMDQAGDELGLKGGGWEERTDWVQQVLRTVCLMYGASLFYTTPTQPTTYTLLRSYLLHRLHTLPPPLHPSTSPDTTAASQHTTTRFPFPHRANVLDRDAVLVPSGWDSWGKINVLREGFDPARVGKAWEASLKRANVEIGEEEEDANGGIDEVAEGEGLEEIWEGMIPRRSRLPKPANTQSQTTTAESEQLFLARQLDTLQKDPAYRDPRASFRAAAAAVSSSASHLTSAGGGGVGGGGGDSSGVVGPVGGGGGLSLPGVEKALVEMEGGGSARGGGAGREGEGGGQTAEELKERFARLGRRESARGGAALPLSPTGVAPTGSGGAAVPNEALHNFFQGLLATKNRSTTPTSTTTAKTPTNDGEMPPPPLPRGAASTPQPPS